MRRIGLFLPPLGVAELPVWHLSPSNLLPPQRRSLLGDRLRRATRLRTGLEEWEEEQRPPPHGQGSQEREPMRHRLRGVFTRAFSATHMSVTAGSVCSACKKPGVALLRFVSQCCTSPELSPVRWASQYKPQRPTADSSRRSV